MPDLTKLPRLGKLPAQHPVGAPLFRKYTVDLPQAPTTFTCTNKMTTLGLMMNDELGDCAIAGPGHQVQFWTAQAGKQVIIPDSAILSAYEAVGGYVPGQPNTDNGCVLVNVMDYWQKTGIGGHQIGGWAALMPPPSSMSAHTSLWHKIFGHEPRIKDTGSWINDFQNALYYFEGAVIGLALPSKLQGYTNIETWDFVPSSDPNSQPGTWGGHCVILIPGYDTTYCNLVSWGKIYKVSWRFLAAYMDEARVAISKDILSGDKSPEGFDYATLNADILARNG